MARQWSFAVHKGRILPQHKPIRPETESEFPTIMETSELKDAEKIRQYLLGTYGVSPLLVRIDGCPVLCKTSLT